ncbi:MAG: hypothetical protein WCA20_14615 [Candidatus Sulfotelmatobacter sp.]
MAINGIHNLLEQCAELLYYLPQFIVVRILQHIFVQIAHEMNQGESSTFAAGSSSNRMLDRSQRPRLL